MAGKAGPQPKRGDGSPVDGWTPRLRSSLPGAQLPTGHGVFHVEHPLPTPRALSAQVQRTLNRDRSDSMSSRYKTPAE